MSRTAVSSSRLFDKVLVANRGEIACRIVRTCRRLGIRTVAVYTSADAQALHVRMADEAVCIGDDTTRTATTATAASADATTRGVRATASGYACAEALLDACLRTRAQAVHPGYGFLAESAAFARLLRQHHVVFVGPDADTMATMSDKAAAKQLAQSLGVPCVRGLRVPSTRHHDDDHTLSSSSSSAQVNVTAACGNARDGQQAACTTATTRTRATTTTSAAAARQVEVLRRCVRDVGGFPVMLKPVRGGGGRGMRVVYGSGHDNDNDDEKVWRDLVAAYHACRRDALAAGGGGDDDDDVLMERYVTPAQHIEVQLLADRHGSVLPFAERACSIQRRRQKLIEETPAPGIDAATRAALARAAVTLARASHYVNAGTVEFLVTPHSPSSTTTTTAATTMASSASLPFYFLEMNTRLQVEHAVSEMLSGVDVVEQMLRIAAGLPMQLAHTNNNNDDDSVCTRRECGHALECRVYAERPQPPFAPSTGRLRRYVEPTLRDVQDDESRQTRLRKELEQQVSLLVQQLEEHEVRAGTRRRATASSVSPCASSSITRLRIDAGVAEGDVVTPHYDALLSKVVVCARDRATCLRAMTRALDAYVIRGVAHNVSLLRDICTSDAFARDGNVTTEYLQTHHRHGVVVATTPRATRARRVLAGATACVRVLRDAYYTTGVTTTTTGSRSDAYASSTRGASTSGSGGDCGGDNNDDDAAAAVWRTYVVTVSPPRTHTASSSASSEATTTTLADTTRVRVSVRRVASRQFALRYDDDEDGSSKNDNNDCQATTTARLRPQQYMTLTWQLDAPVVRVRVRNCTKSDDDDEHVHILQYHGTDEVTYAMQMHGRCYDVAVLTPRQAALSRLQLQSSVASSPSSSAATRACHDVHHIDAATTQTTSTAATTCVSALSHTCNNNSHVQASMPGVVVEVCVRVGDAVAAGDELLVVEAMKMRSAVCATREGVIAAVDVHVGDMVECGDVLVRLA